MRGPDLLSPTTAVRSVAPPDTLALRATAFAEVLSPPWAFSHLTAARLLGWPLAWSRTPDEPLHVVPVVANHPRRER